MEQTYVFQLRLQACLLHFDDVVVVVVVDCVDEKWG